MAPYYVCAKCNAQYRPRTTGMAIEMRPEKNGVYVIEMAEFGPYKVWLADLWICPQCGHKVVAGFGLNALSEHYKPNFAETLEAAKSADVVFYC